MGGRAGIRAQEPVLSRPRLRGPAAASHPVELALGVRNTGFSKHTCFLDHELLIKNYSSEFLSS